MNTIIKKILVPVDFTETSEAATSKAIELATLLSAELYLIHVIEDSLYYGAPFNIVPEGQPAISPSLQEIEGVVKEKMDSVRNEINNKYGIMAHTNITSGRVDTEIIDYAKSEHINLIVMGTHGISGFSEVFVGSNAQRVVTLSEIPVLTIQTAINKGFKKILIPIDNSLHSREKVNIAMKIAELFGSEILVLGLADSHEKKEEDKFKIKLESIEAILNSHNLKFTSTMEHGENLADVALNYAEKNNCDLIVINTGHESRTTGIFMGALAQQIVNHSKTPVLSVRHTQSSFVISTPGSGAS